MEPAIDRTRTRMPAAGLTLALAACGGPADCSAVGCPEGARSSVTVEGPAGGDGMAAGELTVCVEGECQEATFPVGVPTWSVVVTVSGADDGDEVEAALVLPDGSRLRAHGEMADDRPNGEGCPPVCITARLRLEAG